MSNSVAQTTSVSDTAIIIPARYGSSRFPGKPLAMLNGKTMLERVWRHAVAALGAKDLVIVATDDERIKNVANSFGARVEMTPVECENGSERAHAATKGLANSVKFIINLQGDSPLVPPQIIAKLIEIRRASLCDIATLSVPLGTSERHAIRSGSHGLGSGTYVVSDRLGKALYFSRFPIPFIREKNEDAPLRKHIGIYAYTRESLKSYLSLPPSYLEQSEKLEQLRALEAGMTIVVQDCDLGGRTLVSVDTPEDLVKAVATIDKEGELLP